MKRLLCWLFGHKWTTRARAKGMNYITGEIELETLPSICKRCGKVEE